MNEEDRLREEILAKIEEGTRAVERGQPIDDDKVVAELERLDREDDARERYRRQRGNRWRR